MSRNMYPTLESSIRSFQKTKIIVRDEKVMKLKHFEVGMLFDHNYVSGIKKKTRFYNYASRTCMFKQILRFYSEPAAYLGKCEDRYWIFWKRPISDLSW